MLSVTDKPVMLSVDILKVVMLSVAVFSVAAPNNRLVTAK